MLYLHKPFLLSDNTAITINFNKSDVWNVEIPSVALRSVYSTKK